MSIASVKPRVLRVAGALALVLALVLAVQPSRPTQNRGDWTVAVNIGATQLLLLLVAVLLFALVWWQQSRAEFAHNGRGAASTSSSSRNDKP